MSSGLLAGCCAEAGLDAIFAAAKPNPADVRNFRRCIPLIFDLQSAGLPAPPKSCELPVPWAARRCHLTQAWKVRRKRPQKSWRHAALNLGSTHAGILR